MGNTPNLGLPYPANTDPLANVAAAIQALAQAIDAAHPSKWKRGTTTGTFSAAGEFTLTHGLGVVPSSVLVTQRAGGAGTAILVTPKLGTYTSTQVTLVARNGASAFTGGGLTFDWVAVA